jgi:hypothetical protein
VSNRPAREAFGWRSVMAGCGEMFGVDAGRLALSPQQDEQSTVAKPAPLIWRDRAAGHVAQYRPDAASNTGSSCDRRSCRPDARSSPAHHVNEQQPRAWRQAYLFFTEAQGGVVEHGFGQQLPELAALLLERPQPLRAPWRQNSVAGQQQCQDLMQMIRRVTGQY